MSRSLEALAVGLGGAVGTTLRWAITSVATGWTGLLLTNLVGTAIAIVALRHRTRFERAVLPVRPLLVVGLAGGCTTASTVLVALARQPDRVAVATVTVMLVVTVAIAHRGLASPSPERAV